MGRYPRLSRYAAIACLVLLSHLQLGCKKPQVAQEEERKQQSEGLEQPLVVLQESRISRKSIDLIIFHEVSDKKYYEKKLSHPTWPKGQSGVTIGVGYDCGYYSKPVILSDWEKLRKDWRTDLSETSGITGEKAKPIAESLNYISIGWNLANEVFSQTTLSQYYALALRTFPGMEELCPDAQGAITSLVYNRGNSLKGPSRAEMRNIKELVPKKDYEGIAANIRAMKRIWEGKGLNGLLERRDSEADLVLECVRE